ncbi:AI-2E family transporter, partial [Enterocloster citroniae]
TKLFEDNPDVQQAVMPYYEQAVEEFQKWLTEKLVPNMSMIIGQLSTGLLNVVTVVKNILIGVIVMVYFLNIKDTLAAQSKKIIYSVFKLKEANRIVSEVRFAHGVFGGFITGKLLDSLIIGIMCFFALKFLKMPYVLLISVIIGVTNVIPFFGPFIGAIPSAFLILLVSPMKCLYFLIFILILQQFDGNILGPKILGDSTGLPSFWVLFSILLFGGLMGFVGMIIGVPTFAVIYRLTSMYVSNSLVKKDLSSRTEDYLRLDHIDEEEKIYIDRDIQE